MEPLLSWMKIAITIWHTAARARFSAFLKVFIEIHAMFCIQISVTYILGPNWQRFRLWLLCIPSISQSIIACMCHRASTNLFAFDIDSQEEALKLLLHIDRLQLLNRTDWQCYFYRAASNHHQFEFNINITSVIQLPYCAKPLLKPKRPSCWSSYIWWNGRLVTCLSDSCGTTTIAFCWSKLLRNW